MIFDREFRTLYKNLGLLSTASNIKSLHRDCINCSICWSNIESDRFPPENDEAYTVSRPFVGQYYKQNRLAILGINLNEYGGYDAYYKLLDKAKKQLSMGKKKLFRSNSYSGSIVYHRMMTYASIILNDQHQPSGEDLSNNIDNIAFLNHIQCSPIGEKSKPSEQMWENCGSHILRKELAILRPEDLLVLGTTDNLTNTLNILTDVANTYHSKEIRIYEASLSSSKIRVIAICHPTSRGGSSRRLYSQLHEILKDINCNKIQ